MTVHTVPGSLCRPHRCPQFFNIPDHKRLRELLSTERKTCKCHSNIYLNDYFSV